MNLKSLSKDIIVALRFIEVLILKRKRPLAASFALTRRCNYHCLYCGSSNVKVDELNTKEVLLVIDELKRCKVLRVVFTGGEPLLREDIENIVQYAKKKGLEVYINTNGSLLPGKINHLKVVDGFQVSIEGPREVHDCIRGKGSYNHVIEALKAIEKHKIKVSLAATLNKLNIDSIDDIIKIAQQFNTVVSFQPLTLTLLDDNKPNPILPSVALYRKSVDKLIQLKLKGNPYIYNSLSSLKHIYYWPNTRRLLCSAGKLFFRIEADGRVFSCSRFQPLYEGVCIKPEFDLCKIIDNIGRVSCKKCWCAGVIEANLIYSLKPDAILNLFRNRVL